MANALFVIALTASFAVFASEAASRSSYCAIRTCNGQSHTACIFDGFRTSNQCGRVKSSTLTSAEIQDLLDTHNNYRARVASGRESRGSPGPQPAATNLKPLKWDKELADIAQIWADQCAYGHDKCRDVSRFQVGQNIAYTGTTGNTDAPLSQLVTMWYDEVKLFNRNQVNSVTNFNGVGHYTQMMWAETTLLGCGVVRYNPDGKWNKTYLVCNYGPTGNWRGEPMYATR